jgi:hypothetical protein
VAFLNLFAAFSTMSDKRQVLQMADDFSYNVRGFKSTWRDLVELFSLLDHTVMATSRHGYIRHRLELWSDAKKIHFLINMFSEVVHTLSLPPVSPRKHKVMAGHDDVAEMARAMEAARRCEIVADTTQALNADWDKIHNPSEHVRPRQVKHWRGGQRQFQDICMRTGEFNIV